MKIPKYEDIDTSDYSGSEYKIDWHKGHRKYKEPVTGMRVYEHGMVELLKSGYRDPAWRSNISRNYGITFKLLSEMTDCKFIDPNSRVRVKKSWLEETLFFVHGDKAYASPWWNESIRLHSEHALPSTLGIIKYFTRNKQAEKNFKQSLQEHISLGKTLNAISSTDTYWYYDTEKRLSNMNIPSNLTTEEGQSFCKQIARFETKVDGIISKECRNKFETKYLEIEGV